MNRRTFLGAAVAAMSCRNGVDSAVLRLGYFPNLSHASALTGVASGRFARELQEIRLVPQVFNAGPAAMLALLTGSIDAAWMGPPPILTAWVSTRGQGHRVVAGCSSGGSVLVTKTSRRVRTPEDLHGARLATPQLGNSQDVALRTWLRRNHLLTDTSGGDVQVLPMANPDILAQFRLGQLDGAWVPEPWASRIIVEAGAELFVDERDLWPGRRFPSALLVVRAEYLARAPVAVERLVRAHVRETTWLQQSRRDARDAVRDALRRIQGRPLPMQVLTPAWERTDFTTDPLEGALRTVAQNARSLGFLRDDRIDGMVDHRVLRAIV